MLTVALLGAAHPNAVTPSQLIDAARAGGSGPLEDAQRLLYNGHYEAAAAMTLEACAAKPIDFARCELHTAALLLQIKKALGVPSDTEKAWKGCASCSERLSAFTVAFRQGQASARAELLARPDDDAVRFYLGKLDLNYVWLLVGTIGRRTGWGEYWEARKSLDTVLKRNPGHLRARVARAWIDYIVDTKMPRGTKWLLGGGNKKRGLLTVVDAANTNTGLFDQVEARFALWDMQVRERDLPKAVVTARTLARDFPENWEITTFLDLHDRSATR